MPNQDLFQTLINNALLLFGLVLVYGSMNIRSDNKRRLRQILIGLIVGVFGFLIMRSPWQMTEGIFYDTRSVLISITGAFFGFIPTLIGSVITIAYRIYRGGTGMFAGVLTIISSALIGLWWYKYRRDLVFKSSPKKFLVDTFLLGVLVSIGMMACQLAIPWPQSFEIIQGVVLPVLIINPIATAVIAHAMKIYELQMEAHNRIKDSELLLKSIIEGPENILILAIDRNFNYIFFNDAHKKSMLDMYGSTIEVGSNFLDMLHDAEGKNEAFEGLKKALQGESFVTTNQYGLVNFRYLQTVFSPFRDYSGNVIGAVTFTVDISEKVEQGKQLAISEDKLRHLLRAMNLGIASFDIIYDDNHQAIDYRFNNANHSFLTMVHNDDLIGKTLNELFPILFLQWNSFILDVVNSGKSIEFEGYTNLFNRYYMVEGYLPQPGQFALILTDVTEKKEKDDEILHLSYHDHLSGLFNRRYYVEQIARLSSEEYMPLSLILFDINGLKLVNDAFGHNMGDEIIISFAKQLTLIFRPSDIISRIGGDEFVVLLPNTNRKNAEELIKKLPLRIHSSIEGIHATSSYGVVTINSPAESIIKITSDAEREMYYKKLYELTSQRSETIKTILNTLHLKSQREELHSLRVSTICQTMGTLYHLSADEIKQLTIIGNLHDIGKIGIDNNILDKKGKLTPEEWEEVKRHPEIGYRILSTSFEYAPLAEAILAHHERWDGTGYPQRLKGEQIPWRARIVAIADAYDAMTSPRPYRKMLSDEEAAIEIIRCAGTQFDPNIAQMFVTNVLHISWPN